MPPAQSAEGSDTTTTTQLDRIDLPTGETFTVETAAEGTLVISLESKGDSSTSIESALKGVSSLREMYDVVAPGRAMPEQLVAALDVRQLDLDSAFSPAEAPAPEMDSSELPALGVEAPAEGVPELELDQPGIADSFALQNKEASRNVQQFLNDKCNPDKLNEGEVSGPWFRLRTHCLTERTGDFTHYTYNVRQDYFSTYVYRGTTTIKWSGRALGANAWTAGNTHTVAEGTTRAFWLLNSSAKDYKFELTNATGDGYNFTIHTAQADYGQKRMTGNDYWHMLCNCSDGAQYLIEYCSNNDALLALLTGGAMCTRLANKLGSSATCEPAPSDPNPGYEQVSSGQSCADGSERQTLRECGTLLNNCEWSCSSSCNR